METRARYALIGAFTLLVVAMGFVFIYWLKRLDETGLRTPVVFEFEGSVSGLAPGSAVYFAGIKVGAVTALSFDEDDPNKIIVTADVREDIPAKTDTRAEVGSNFLTGVSYIEMYGGSREAGSLFAESPARLQGSKSGISDIINAASSTISKVEAIISRLDEFLQANQESITKTTANVEAFTGALAANSDGVNAFLENVSQMSDTVGALSQRLTDVVEKADGIISAVDPARVESVVANADRFIEGVANSTADIDEIATTAKSIAGDLAAFSERLKLAMADVQEVIEQVEAENVVRAIDNVSAFSDTLANSGPTVEQIIADAGEAVSGAKTAIEGANGVIANAKDFTETLKGQDENVKQIVANVRELSDGLKETSKKLDSVLGKADDFLGEAGGEAGENFFKEAAAAAKAIRNVAETVDSRADDIVVGVADFSTRGLGDVSELIKELRASVTRIDRAVADFSRSTGSLLGGNSGVRDYNRR